LTTIDDHDKISNNDIPNITLQQEHNVVIFIFQNSLYPFL